MYAYPANNARDLRRSSQSLDKRHRRDDDNPICLQRRSHSASLRGLRGARLQQIVNNLPTTYTLDLAAPLVQVLTQQDADGETAYLYGVTRIGEQQPDGWAYHLSDARPCPTLHRSVGGPLGVGSVRQLADGDGQITLARGYTPYGESLWSEGTGQSAYGYTGENFDVSTGLVFLRARYMNPALGLFLSRDPWSGDVLWPGSMNGWNYVEVNPVNRTDPSGLSPRGNYPALAASFMYVMNSADYRYILSIMCQEADSASPLFLSLGVYLAGEANVDATFGYGRQLDFGRALQPGAIFVAKVLIPPSASGQLKLWQEIKPNRSVEVIEGMEGGTYWHHFLPQDQWALDSKSGGAYGFAGIDNGHVGYRYPSDYFFYNIQKFWFTDWTIGIFSTWDSPGTTAPVQVERTKFQVVDEFRLFLTWKPSAKPETTLALATWGWSANARKERGGWIVSRASSHEEAGRPSAESPIKSPLFPRDFHWAPPFSKR